MKKIYYIFNGRFPSEKAHALYAAKSCEAFSRNGYDVVLLVPRRARDTQLAYPDFFGIEKSFSVNYLPTVDLYRSFLPTKLAFFVNHFFFSLSVCMFVLLRKKEEAVYFSHEVLSSLALAFSGRRVVYEMHDYPDSYRSIFSLLFSKAHKLVTQNQWKKERLLKEFHLDAQKILVEQNGVDIEDFDIPLSKEESRAQLGLPSAGFIALYTGHLFDWKGAHVLAESAEFLDAGIEVIFVGGSEHDVESFKKLYGDKKNIHVKGYKPHAEIPLWQKAADCLILPNTATQDISKYYTSPMKLFEYMASERPIIASDIPSIRAIVNEDMVTFVIPDDPKLLSKAIADMSENYISYEPKVELARRQVLSHTWTNRAKRIATFAFEL